MSLEAVAAQMGASDLFVLHRVLPGRVVNVDGHGRGAGWAGNLDVDPGTEPLLAGLLESGTARLRSGIPQRVFGPYWATEAVGVTSGEYIVVFGGPGVADVPPPAIGEAAESAIRVVGEVPVAKRLADDLEVAQAALAVADLRPDSMDAAARAVATAAATATSCEFGAVLLYGPPMSLHLAEEGWRPSAGEHEIIAALLPLGEAHAGGVFVEQDTSQSPLSYRPLAFEDGLIARCAVTLGTGGDLGLLVVAHSIDAPRGFTLLCQRVMRTIAERASAALQSLPRSA